MAARRGLVYEVWDVFTGRRLRGNQLAVFPDAGGLAAETMLDIAREMNYSESTFVIPRAAEVESARGVQTRIFLRTGEIPFAGHPVLGTAFALWSEAPERTDAGGRRLTLELGAGAVPVEFRKRGEAWEGEMTQPDPVFGEKHTAAAIAPLIGVRAEDIEEGIPVQTVSTGRPNVLVMLKTLRALQGAVFDWGAIDRYLAGGDKERGFYLLCRETVGKGRQFHARKIGRGFEDPVTGSAAGAAIAWLVAHGVVESGARVVMEQGTEIQREGELFAVAERSGEKVGKVRVGGQAVRTMQGVLEL